MQVVSPFYLSNPSIKSTIDLTDLSLLSLLLIKNFDCILSNVNDPWKVNTVGVLNYESLTKTELSHTCTINHTLIFKHDQDCLNNCPYKNGFQKSCKDFMDDGKGMSATNSKRYLQNKLGDRKRRRPDSAIIEPSEMDDSVDSSIRCRQTTRQSMQRNLMPVAISLQKSNKIDKTCLTPSGSKKHLRSSKHDTELFCDNKELTDQCDPTNNLKNSVEELLKNNNDISNTTCKRNCDNLKSNNYSIENEENNTKVDDKDCKDNAHREEHNLDKNNFEREGNNEGNAMKINNLNMKTHDQSKSNNNDSNIMSEKSNKKLCESHTASADDYPMLAYKNMNPNSGIDTTNSSYIISETLNQSFRLGVNSWENDKETQELKKTENNTNENNNFTPAHLCESDSLISLRPALGSLNNDNKNHEVYEDHLSHISNSLCSDSLSSNSCCKTANNIDSVSNNESKSDLEDPNKTNSAKLEINSSHTNLVITQPENDSVSAQEDEQCQNFNNDKNNGCSIKSESVYNITKLGVHTHDVSSNYAKTQESPKCESIQSDYKSVEHSLEAENIEYRKEVDNKQEDKSLRLYVSTEDSQIINMHKNDHNTDSGLENNLGESSAISTRKPDDKYKESQHSEKASNQQQLPKDINTADKLYTQIEEEFHHHQPDVTSLSSDYGQLINNNQQSSQEESGHDINLSHQQDPPQQHSVHQQQQYSNAHLYQLHPQDHHQQLHIQHQQMQKEIELQQHHHNISHDTQRESGPQEHSLMEFLHPQHHHSSTNIQSPLHQQQHQIHEVYHDLMMEEFHEDHHTPYKLSLSPSTVKHENQDDGYETSAGDVLTPNSHASSTHSVTPQHHLHHSTGGSGFAANISKCEEQHAQQQQPNIQLQQSQHNCNLINEQIMHQELTSNESAKHLTPRDTYHFMDDDLNSPNNNNNLRNILTPPHSHSRAVNQEVGTMNHFLSMQSDVHSNMLNSASDIYGLTSSTVNRHLTEKQNVIEPISTTTVTNTNHQQHFLVTGSVMPSHDQDSVLNIQTKSLQKKRGRKKKIPQDGILPTLERTSLNELSTGYIKAKERKKHDRFNGMSEEEIVKRSLPDHLCENLDIVIIGINPGLFAAYKGHHYAGPGNHFWKCLYLSGLTQEQMSADEDFKLIKCGIGFTNMVQRATKGSADLTRKEIKEGSRILLEKLQRFRPKIAVFNGKLIFEVFSGRKDFNFGKQPECVEGTDTFIWVMPSSSARCAQLPRAADKVPFYAALKKFRDYLNGLIPHIDQSECVFTDERIKQQCEEQNFKNQQNNISGETSDTFSNNVSICNSDKLLQSNTFDSESNPHGAGGGPGPPQSSTGDSTGNTSFMMSSLVGTHQEKKKRGRPKKIKEQELIDPLTGNKIQVNTQILTPGSGEYSNILNLSVAQVPNEMPKKKRGRPKKVKLPTNALQGEVESSPILSQKSNIFSIHSMTTDVIQSSPHHMQGIKQSHQHASIYSTPPSQHQQNIYSPMVSPMASPSLNCSYTTNTPPSQPNQEKMVLPANERESSKTTSEVLVTSQNSLSEQNFCESPRPNSPNICAVDFNPPAASTANSLLGNNVNSNINTMHHQRLQSIQKPRFNSPGNGEATPDHNTNSEPFQQWLSPQHNNHGVQSPAAATIVSNTVFSNSSQQTPLNYHEQQQVQALQQQDIHAQWPLRHQSRYDDGPYLLTSSVHQTQPHRHESHHHQQQHHSGSDVARKSLSGLESLVDQIPSISESETIALSSAAAVNVQVAAAAAVENRLQSMQNSSHNDSQVGDDSHFPTITRSSNLLTANSNPTSAALSNNQMQQSASLLNTNFSVSNLAASSAPNNNQENYGISSNSRSLTNSNAYHHSNLMAAAVLAAAAASSPSHLSTPSSAPSTAAHHAQMYMDPHSHLTTHVPINSIYPATATSHHHHSAVAAHHHHHSAAVHYNTGPHSATDYTTNNLYPSSQSNAATGHTLHMPSPNYPYGYSTASSQSNYSAYPHTHANHHHGHPHAHHTAHHLGMFDRLKPSDITGYSGGF